MSLKLFVIRNLCLALWDTIVTEESVAFAQGMITALHKYSRVNLLSDTQDGFPLNGEEFPHDRAGEHTNILAFFLLVRL